MFLELAAKRRSVRRYAPESVAPELVERLVEAAVRAPSSRGLNPWHFVVVADRRVLADLAKAKPHGASFLKNAPLAVVVCADPARADTWVEDAAIAATYLHLAAADLGLGSCWVQIRLRERAPGHSSSAYVAERLGLPAGMEVEAILAVGHPAERPAPHPRESLPFDQVSYERFGRRP